MLAGLDRAAEIKELRHLTGDHADQARHENSSCCFIQIQVRHSGLVSVSGMTIGWAVAYTPVRRNFLKIGIGMSVLIIIPARMKATRLPNKPMAMIGDVPMIVQVWRRAMESRVGDVIVACDGIEIAQAIRAAGGEAVLTDPDHPSGSDRIWEALVKREGAVAAGTVVPSPFRRG